MSKRKISIFSKFKKLLFLLLAPFGYLIPRKKNLWVFGTLRNVFYDNSKYLFLHVVENCPEIEAVWISDRKEVVSELRSQGFKAIYKFSFWGVWTCLRAKVYFYTSNVRDLNYYTSFGAVLVNLWHGTPIKKIEHDIKVGPLAKYYDGKFRLMDKILIPDRHTIPDILLSSSKFVSQNIFKSAFLVKDKNCLEIGYPRSDIFFWEQEKQLSFIKKYEPQSTQKLITSLQKFRQVIIYMPTFRDSGTDFIAASKIDFEALNSLMEAQNDLFIFKLHISTLGKIQLPDNCKNLLFLSGDLDIYTFLPFTDVLITDYSSIYYDYLLLQKRVVLFPFDFDEYLNESRSLYFDYQEFMVGDCAFSFEELLKELEHKELKEFALNEKQLKIRQQFWDNYQGHASENLVKYLN